MNRFIKNEIILYFIFYLSFYNSFIHSFISQFFFFSKNKEKCKVKWTKKNNNATNFFNSDIIQYISVNLFNCINNDLYVRVTKKKKKKKKKKYLIKKKIKKIIKN